MKKFVFSTCLSFIAYLYIYTFLHEMGHGLIGMLAGGSIDRLVLGLNARVYISNANYNKFTLPLMNIMGMLLPYLVFLVISLFYNKNYQPILYKIFHGISVIGILGSLVPWVVIPVISLFDTPPPGDDVTHFLENSWLYPLIVSFAGLLLLGLFFLVAKKKGILENYFNLVKSLRTVRNQMKVKNNGG